jgi:AcrR family transcriptional regulator
MNVSLDFLAISLILYCRYHGATTHSEINLDLPASEYGRASGPSALKSERRNAFVVAARSQFLAHGYASTTMSSISMAAGGSKSTLWAQFPVKEDLFVAVINDIMDQHGHVLVVDLSQHEPVVDALGCFAAALFATMLSPQVIALNRLIIGEAARSPQLGKLFYDRGPKRVKARLSAYFEQAMANGQLRAGDPDVATRHFASMCQANCYQDALFDIESAPTSDAIAIDITSSIDSFMRAWGPVQNEISENYQRAHSS